MKKNISSLYSQLEEKRGVIESARIQLKKEFVGLDNVIDQVVDLSSTWYLFPELQERPTIINLWGLTGTGKTSLVKRFSQLLDFDKKYFRFDMKGDMRSHDLEDVDEVNSSTGNNYMILSLDEFQHLPTSKYKLEGLWDLLDSGKIEYNSYSHSYFWLQSLWIKLDEALRQGVEVLNGCVIKGKSIYNNIVEDDFDPIKEEETIWFFPSRKYAQICDLDPINFPLEWQVRDFLAKLDGEQTVTFIKSKIKEFGKPRVLDCSHALIFVLGNLDKAYKMAKDFNPDLNADEFHMLSKKITISHIKNSLQTLDFRSEQISRLGNNHIIYPAFSSQSYKLIINIELERVKNKFMEQFGIKLLYDPSVLDLIYREGVYPTQGTRPVFSTINQIITSKLGLIVGQMAIKKLKCSLVAILSRADKITIQFLKRETILHSIEITQQLNLESLRKNRRDDMQAISAVHESGHALLSMILLRTIPDAIYSVTAEANTSGFIHSRMNWDYITRNQVLLQLATMYGGYAAEQFVFGKYNLTAGSDSDLQHATYFASEMLKSCGMGETPYYYQVASPYTNYTVEDKGLIVNDEIKELLDTALKLAEQTLKEQERLLIEMSEYLADNRSMSKDLAREMLDKFISGNGFEGIIDNGDLLFYRDALMNRAKMIKGQVSVPSNSFSSYSICLNINKNSDTNS
jgi:hypothetical protein